MNSNTREPIWKREGFATRNQYRNAQAAKIINPATGKPFTSYRQYRDARARELGRPRDYELERERADIRARSQGFRSARDRQQKNRARKIALSITPAEALAKWNISLRTFNTYRSKNRQWSDKHSSSSINQYDMTIDKDLKNFSDERVGYVISYYKANVDRATNYWSLYTGKRRRHEYGYPVTNEWQRKFLVDYSSVMTQNEFDTRYGGAIIH